MSGNGKRKNTRKNKPRIIELTEIDPSLFYKSAGCAFTDGKTILGGRQWISKKGKEMFSGFGGKKESEDSNYLETALRESIEELFFIEPPKANSNITKQIRSYVRDIISHGLLPIRTYLNTLYKYVLCVYTYYQLEALLTYLNSKGFSSPLYETFPLTVSDLVDNRTFKENKLSEIRQINEINIRNKTVKRSKSKENMTNEFLNNIQTLINH